MKNNLQEIIPKLRKLLPYMSRTCLHLVPPPKVIRRTGCGRTSEDSGSSHKTIFIEINIVYT